MTNNENFFNKVYAVTRLVPHGRVTTYGHIARYLGSAQSSRMVGWAMNKSFGQSPFVPAHRVVNRFGLLSGKIHFGGMNTMAEMLLSEGIKVIDDQIVDFEKLLWNPLKELG